MTEDELQNNLSEQLTGITTASDAQDNRKLLHRILTRDVTENDIPDHIYRAYLRSILGGTGFEMPINMFEGELVITFKEAPYNEADQFNKVAVKIADNPIAVSQLALLVYISKMHTKNGNLYTCTFTMFNEALSPSKSSEDLVQAVATCYSNAFGHINESVHRVLPVLYAGFNHILTLLISKGIPETF